MSITTANELFDALKKIIDLPTDVTYFKIESRIGELPTITIERYIGYMPQDDKMIVDTKHYRLVEIDDTDNT